MGSIIIVRISARSRTFFAIAPKLSNVLEKGITPSMEVILGVTRSLYKAAPVAGMITDPVVSVPMAIGAYLALTLTADPVDEPPGLCMFC